MRTLIRSDRFAALLLLLAALIALVLANSPIAEVLLAGKHAVIELPGLPLRLSAGHWVSDGLLAIFFFVAAAELKHELLRGQLNSRAKALRPVIAAGFGVLVPTLLYLLVTAGTGFERGWPIPTATDIAFALGILAVFGRGLPSRVRIFLLALAILDDLAGIVFIGLLFTSDLDLASLGWAALALVTAAVVSRGRLITGKSGLRVVALVLLSLVVWYCVVQSGVHATIAGVLVAFIIRHDSAQAAAEALRPFSNLLVLPLFAFTVSLVALPAVGIEQLSPAFFGVLLALPVGKLIGVFLGGVLASRLGKAPQHHHDTESSLKVLELVAAGFLSGIGFTVSLLLGELAFAQDAAVRDEVIVAVLAGSLISAVLGSVFVAALSRSYRKRALSTPEVLPG